MMASDKEMAPQGRQLPEARPTEKGKHCGHHQAPWTWRVPSCSGPLFYVVDLKNGLCTCSDHPPEGERCKHVSAAAYKKAKTATCSGCKNRFRHRDLYEVQDWHESLTWFEGDLLCEGCALDSGIL